MNEDLFNAYCAKVMGYKDSDLNLLYDRNYDPYNDLNHMADVVDRIIHNSKSEPPFDAMYAPMMNIGVKQAFRDFIEANV